MKEKPILPCNVWKGQLLLFQNLKNHPASAVIVEHLLVYPGKVAEEIVEKANWFGCEAIVLGSHGARFLTRIFSDVCAASRQTYKKNRAYGFFEKGKINVTTYNKGEAKGE